MKFLLVSATVCGAYAGYHEGRCRNELAGSVLVGIRTFFLNLNDICEEIGYI